MNDLMQPSSTAPAELRHRIQDFEDILLEHEQLDMPVTEYFCNGIYCREITIPAGALVTGHIHKYPCLNIVLTGEIEVVTDEGPKHCTAGMVFESPAGVKRAARGIVDCRWLTIHLDPGQRLDPAAMGKLLTVESYEELALLEAPE